MEIQSVNRGRRHIAIRTMRGYNLSLKSMEHMVIQAHQVINVLTETKKGITKGKLTNISSKIGESVISTKRVVYKEDIEEAIRIGDFFIEAFLNLKFLTIKPPPPKSRLPVEVVLDGSWPGVLAEEKVVMALKGVWSKKPADIKGATQTVRFKDGPVYNYKLIKRWDEKLDGFVSELIDTQAFQAVNRLQQTPWTVNEFVWDVVSKQPHMFYQDDCKSDENQSKYIDYMYTINKAKALIGEEFYFAADMDYRSRIYFKESYLNFQGSDLARGLLTFYDKKLVTEVGLRWMKIHAAASYNASYRIGEIPTWCSSDYKTHLTKEGLTDISVDKMTLRDRELWCDNNKELIYETIQDKKLHDCEKPVAFLGICLELTRYWDSSGPYYSSLPIPVDGSNNGWQHLGAISKDIQTGGLVGLSPIEIQNDFYVQTAKRLKEITKDPERSLILATMPMKAIRKAISKRGSMTRAYSAGASSIAENMYNDVHKEAYDVKYGITEEHCKGFARDLIKAIKDVCPGPLETMKYLQQIAATKLAEGWCYLRWKTPAGFPVFYYNNYERERKIKSAIKGYTGDRVTHIFKELSDVPNNRGFACGISPNFIHSQDASHMQLVINKYGGSFGAVHDSFSTHADSVDELVDITKQVFIKMYDHRNYFDHIADRFEVDLKQPTLGTLDIKGVVNSDYFFA